VLKQCAVMLVDHYGICQGHRRDDEGVVTALIRDESEVEKATVQLRLPPLQ
jgi:hypothetical protein